LREPAAATIRSASLSTRISIAFSYPMTKSYRVLI
jgi:hypothetical protein